MDPINRYLSSHVRWTAGGERALTPPLVCNDGFSMSVQASRQHFCLPCADFGPYSKVEVADPSQPTPALKPYENGGIYGRVPVEILLDIIDAHGGIKKECCGDSHPVHGF